MNSSQFLKITGDDGVRRYYNTLNIETVSFSDYVDDDGERHQKMSVKTTKSAMNKETTDTGDINYNLKTLNEF